MTISQAMKALTFLATLLLTSAGLWAQTAQQKDALQRLKKLLDDGVITAPVYEKRALEILGGEKQSDEGAGTFASEHFTAKFRRMTTHSDGELSVVVDLLKPAGGAQVVVRLNADAHFNFQKGVDEVVRRSSWDRLGIRLTGADGVEYRLTDVSGIGFISFDANPPALSDKAPTTATFRFRRISPEARALKAPATLDAPLAVFVRVDRDKGWERIGITTLHLEGLRFAPQRE